MRPLARLLRLWPPIVRDGLTRSLLILYCPSMHRSWKRVPTIEARLSGGVAAAEPADLHSSRCRQPLEPFGHEARRRAPLAEWTFPCLMRHELAAELGRKTTHQGETKSTLAYIRSEPDTVIPDANSDTAIGGVCDAHEDFA